MSHISEVVQKLLSSEEIRQKGCPHIDMMQDVTPSAQGCEECLKIGDTWVHLRICLTCGKVGCCDNSKNMHARKHYQEGDHPIIKSFEPGEDWVYCYPDDKILSYG